MAPASMLALTETHLNVPKEYQFALTVVRLNNCHYYASFSESLIIVIL